MPHPRAPSALVRLGPDLVAALHAPLDDTEVVRVRSDLVEAIGRHGVRGVVIDVTALDVLDSFTCRTVRDIAEVARLCGVTTVVVGIHPDVALAMVTLGIGAGPVHTALDLDQGLELLDGRHRFRGEAPPPDRCRTG